ncbi:MAG TPA: ABC transporter substrate-binding protein [Candidatus Limnocylindria bacterium]|jgi:ABC-type nitrate/sulfonate/bicarbonate transport system substrate-binding protein|nr:ABC transporter substrate-binding protein [Candidatus Limnocylindria bacterium]
MRSISRTTWLATVLASSVVIAACGGGAAPSAAPPAAASPARGELPKPELTRLRIGLSTPSEPVQFAQKLADMLGIYQKYGFATVEIIGFEGDGKALQALMAGQLDMMAGGSSSTINTVITDTPMKVLSMNSVNLTDGLWCTASIKTAADVKGKTVAISTFGGTSHGAALLGLQGLGLTPKDATITQIGGESARIAALKGGSVGCGVVDMGQEVAMRQAGLNLLVDLKKAKLQWGRSGLQARTDFIQKYPNTVLVAVASVVEAQNSIFADPRTAAQKFSEFAQIPLDKATTAIDGFLQHGDRSMMFTEEAFKAPKEVLAAVNPAIANVDVTKAFDHSFLNRLKEIGFYEKNNIPLN